MAKVRGLRGSGGYLSQSQPKNIFFEGQNGGNGGKRGFSQQVPASKHFFLANQTPEKHDRSKDCEH